MLSNDECGFSCWGASRRDVPKVHVLASLKFPFVPKEMQTNLDILDWFLNRNTANYFAKCKRRLEKGMLLSMCWLIERLERHLIPSRLQSAAARSPTWAKCPTSCPGCRNLPAIVVGFISLMWIAYQHSSRTGGSNPDGPWTASSLGKGNRTKRLSRIPRDQMSGYISYHTAVPEPKNNPYHTSSS